MNLSEGEHIHTQLPWRKNLIFDGITFMGSTFRPRYDDKQYPAAKPLIGIYGGSVEHGNTYQLVLFQDPP